MVGAFGEDVPLPVGDPAVQTNWRFKSGDARVAPTIVTIAPGLVVYKSSVRSGRIDLEDDNQKSKAWVIATTKKRPLLDAPVVKSGVVIGDPAFTHIDLEMSVKPPADAIAIVLTDKNGTPRSWGLVLKDATLQQAYSSNRCEVVPNGSTLSQAGEQVRFFWVDKMGRVSPKSKLVTLGGKPIVPGLH